MLGLMFLLGIGVFGLLVWWGMWFAQRRALAMGQTPSVARRWKCAVLGAVLLLIFWDWLPTWIAYEYYSRQAGLQVFKTLEQWQAENPGVAQTLEPYRDYTGDKRSDPIRLPNGVSRYPLNARFAVDEWKEAPFLSIRAWRRHLIDPQTNTVLVKEFSVTAGNSGGIATGGAGWWKPWLIRGRSQEMEDASTEFQRMVERARRITEGKPK